jgi:signal transduction histidine kinase
MIQARGFSKRVTVGLVLIVVTVSAAALATLDLSTAANDRHVAEARTYFNDLLVAQRLRAAVEEAVSSSRGYLLSGKHEFIRGMNQSQRTIEDLLVLLEGGHRSAENRQLVSDMKEAVRAYAKTAQAAIDQKRRGSSAAGVTYIFERELMPRRQRLDQLLDSFVRLQQRQFHLGSERLERERARTLPFVVSILSLGVFISAALALALARHLTTLYRREQSAIATAERAAAAREELLATVAHDLRSPLGVLGLRATILRRATTDDQVRKQADAIERVVTRMDQLLKGLLDTATIEAGRFSLDRSAFSATGLMQELMDLFGDTATSRSVVLAQRSGAGDLWLQADRERTIQVLSNLIVNAIKFTPPDGRVDLSAQADGAAVRFTVRDTGPGIAAEQLTHVFERFWRAGAGGAAGTGLGLHIAREIVTAHGGRIWAESQPGNGTAFHFTLPAAPPPAAQASPGEPAGAGQPIIQLQPRTADR